MTKETKIGLLVGLGVIIFIGILISDHLSVAQQQQPADLTQLDTNQSRGVSNTQPNTWSVDHRREPLPPSNDEVVVNTGGEQTGVGVDDHSLMRQGEGFRPYTLQQDTDRDGNAVTPPGGDRTTHVLGNPPAGNTNLTSGNRDKVHFVEKGDSLYKIAQKYYGDGSQYKSIYEANKDKMKSPADLRLGVRLVIPDRGGDSVGVTPPADNTTGTTNTTVTTVDPNLPPSMRDVAPPVIDNTTITTTTTTGGTKTYTIQKGDVLGTLAQKFYGTSKAWPKLVALNKGVINDPDHLVVGTVIKVPQ